MRDNYLLMLGVLAVITLLLVPNCLFNPTLAGEKSFISEKKELNSIFSRFNQKDTRSSFRDSKGSLKTRDVSLPFHGFVQNLGQVTDDQILYYYSTSDLSIGFSLSKITFFSTSARNIFSVSFLGSQAILPIGQIKMNHFSNYFRGDFQFNNIPNYAEIWYFDLYPGIDLRYYMSNYGLKYEFQVHPGADPNIIKLHVNGPMRLSIEDQCVSFQSSALSTVLFQDISLSVYQADNTPINAYFVSKGHSDTCYGFQIDNFDPTQVLIIDPIILQFSTFMGGSMSEHAYDIATDAAGNTYIAGSTGSTDFPTPNGYDSSYNGPTMDAIVSKFNPEGILLFSTYLGGSSWEAAYGITVDSAGNSYITGATYSIDFPTINAYDNILSGIEDIFVTKLNATGNGLIFSTYLGGTSDDSGKGIAVDSAGNSYITGWTESTDFPTLNAYDASYNGGNWDIFVTKLNVTGTGLVFSTYLGGSDTERPECENIVVDSSGNSYIVGYTQSTDFPTLNAYDSSHNGNWDVIVAKFNTNGNLLFSTYLGGSDWDTAYGVAVDSSGNSYITGVTESANFPTLNAYNASHNGKQDIFVTKLNVTGTGLVFSTYLGTSEKDVGKGIAVDSAGNSYISGFTNSSSFPTLNAYDTTYNGGFSDVIVMKLNTTGTGLVFSTYLGGTSDDIAEGIDLDAEGNMYITGYTQSSDFPTKNAYKSILTDLQDIFVVKLLHSAPSSTSSSFTPTSSSNSTTSGTESTSTPGFEILVFFSCLNIMTIFVLIYRRKKTI